MKRFIIFELVRSIIVALVGVYHFDNIVEWNDRDILLALGYVVLCVYVIIKSSIDIYRFVKSIKLEKEESLSPQEV